ncbi:MAG: sigma-54 interaction domain-containing protein [Thiohalospira sp.]
MDQEQKPRCDQVIEILPDPLVIIDADYRIVSANRRYSEAFGWSPEAVVGRRCHEVSHQSDEPCSRHGEHCPLESVFGEGQAVQVIHVHYDAEGREERVRLQASPIHDEAGNIRYMGEVVQPLPEMEERTTPLVGRSRPLMRLVGLLQRVAPTRTTVLLQGGSGVGKECVAHYLHQHSDRAQAPFVVVDCGTLGESLIESELFGHEKGAFTGAAGRKKGLFEAAHGGTLFVDEIGELPLALQTKLLRALETGTIRRLGGNDYQRVDVRVVAATNRDLGAMVEAGTFRADLYYRLSAFPVEVPDLAERKDDIPALAEHFLARIEGGDRFLPLGTEMLETLLMHDYPGNVRELRNILERAVILAGEGPMRPEYLFAGEGARNGVPPTTGDTVDPDRLLQRRRGRVDTEAVRAALQACDGHRGQAADRLGVSERTLYRYLRELRGENGARSGSAAG